VEERAGPNLNLSLSEERSAPTEGGAGRGAEPARRITQLVYSQFHIPAPPLASFDEQAVSDSLHDTVDVHQHFAVPEADDGEPSLFD
jgi:hypothetical protein